MADQSRGLGQRGNPYGSPPVSKGKNFLFAIAINDYMFCSKLNNAVDDVEAFINLMSKRFDFEEENILFIKDKEATKKRIETEFLRLIRKISPQDNLVVYFSGHGRYDEQYGGNWVPVEAGTSHDDWADYLANDQIKSYLGKIKSKHTFLIADSCFSGSLFMDKSKEKFTGDRLDTVPSRWGLTSGKKEIVSDGNPGQHSPFAQALLDVYSRADQPPSTTMICAMVIEMVIANAQQTPMGSPLAIDGHKGGQMVFYFKDNEDEIWQTLKDTPDGCLSYLQHFPEGTYKVLAEEVVLFDKQRKAWDLAKAANTKSALYRYEREYPDSEAVRSHAVDRALEALDEEELREEALWEEAKNTDKVSAYRRYLGRSILKKYEQAASEAIDKILKQEELQVWQRAKQDNTTVAYQKYLREFPFGEFREEAQMVLANIGQNKPENPLFALPHETNKDLTGQIDLDNPEYKLYNFQSTGKNGVKIEIWVNGIQKITNFKFRKKDIIRIKYSKEYYEDLGVQGTITSSQIGRYLKVGDNNLVKLELDVALSKKVRKIRFELRDSKSNLVPGAEISCTNSKNHVKFAKKDENFEIKFEGEELKDAWMVEAKKGNLIAKDCLIIPKSSDDIVNLALVPHLKVRFEVTHDSKPLLGYIIQIPGKKIKQGATEVEFIGAEIDKTWKITISHGQRGYEDRIFDFCPAKDGEFKSVSLYKKQPQSPPPTVGYKVSAGKHGVLIVKDLISMDHEGFDVKNHVIANAGYKLEKFTLQGDTLVAQYRKTNPYLKVASLAFMLIVFIVLIWVTIPSTDQGANNTEEYIHGIELKKNKLEELKKTYCESDPDVKEKPKKSLWEIIFSSDSRGNAKSTPTTCLEIQDALNIRLAINSGRLDELQNRVYSDDQKQFEHAINSIDGKFKAMISGMIFKSQYYVSEMNLNQIADFIKNHQKLLKLREKVKTATNIMELEVITLDIDKISFPVDSVKDNIKEEIILRKSNLRENQESLLPPGKPVKSIRELVERRWEVEFWRLVTEDGPVELGPFRDLFANFGWSDGNETKKFYEKYMQNEKNFKKFQAIPEIDRRNAQTLDQLRALMEK